MEQTISETRFSALSPELLREIRRLHIQARRLVTESFSGTYRSAYRGRGIEFDEVREYTPGDDVRTIDWKVTARFGKPFIKSFREERELTVILVLDVSASTHTATRGQLRKNLIAKLGATLALIAHANNDRVGMLTFSDRVEKYIPPSKSRSTAWQIIHHVLSETKEERTTDLGNCLSFLTKTLHRRALVFLISDFISPIPKAELRLLAARHDVTALIVEDPADFELPQRGLAWIEEPESQSRRLIDFSSAAVKEKYIANSKKLRENLIRSLNAVDISTLSMMTNRPFIPVLKKHFEGRVRRIFKSK